MPMASLTQIRPQITAITLQEALQGAGAWQVWTREGGLTAPSATIMELPLRGVSVSTDDLDTDWAFVGVPGAQRHGATLAELAMISGACVIVTDEAGATLAQVASLPIVVVEDPRAAAAAMAANIYGANHRALTLAGVTGTNGKTTTTYFLRAALEPNFGRMGLLGTLQVDTGEQVVAAERTTHEAPVVHRALAAVAQAGVRGAVVEVSSHALSLGRVDGLEFDLAVFTNLQHDHLDFYHDSMEEYFAAKVMLFDPARSKRGVVAVDDDYGRRLARSAQVPVQAVQVLTDDDPDIGEVPLWRVTDIRADPRLGGNRFSLVSPSGEVYDAGCPIPGLVNVQDAALAIVGAQALGVRVADAARAVLSAPAVPGRMQWLLAPEEHLPTVLVDYAHTPEALERLLVDIRPLASGKLTLVFGTDGDRDASKRFPLGQIAASLADVIWVTDENPRWEDARSIRAALLAGIQQARPGLEGVVEVTTSRRDAIREAIYAASPDDIVVLSGKGAETYQELRGVKHHQCDADIVLEVFDAYRNQATGKSAKFPLGGRLDRGEDQ